MTSALITFNGCCDMYRKENNSVRRHQTVAAFSVLHSHSLLRGSVSHEQEFQPDGCVGRYCECGSRVVEVLGVCVGVGEL